MKIPFINKIKYQPLNTIILSRENLVYNYNYLSSLTDCRVAPVLKSNAYGHGIVQVAKILDNSGAPFFCVDSIHEGYQLLKAKIKTPILIMGYIHPENLAVKKLPFSYTVYSEYTLQAIKKYQPQAGIHIFVDTGMHREGVLLEDLPAFIKNIKRYGLHVEGLMSHLGKGESSINIETKAQIARFIEAKKIMQKHTFSPKYIHFQASSGMLHSNEYPKELGNTGRVGIALYGIDPEGKNTSLKPVLRVESTVVQIKKLLKGEKIGYDFTFTAKTEMRIAIVPMGYNDGIQRGLSNKGFVKLGETFCPIVGRVSMNITVVDITNVGKVQVGDKLVVYSSSVKEKNNIQNVARLCEKIPYEILVQLHPSTKRIIT